MNNIIIIKRITIGCDKIFPAAEVIEVFPQIDTLLLNFFPPITS